MKKFLLILLIAIGLFSSVIAMQPDDYHYSRTATMSAPASAIFTQVNDFHKWEAWSPWAKIDPQAKSRFEGPTSGQGATMHWAGNHEVGEGNMTITDSRPDEKITIRLEFIKPLPGISTSEFTFKPEGSQTVVTWSMWGKNNFIGKAMGLIMNCEKMITEQFDKGLASIKTIVENGKGTAQ